MPDQLWSDVSEFQVPVDDSYPYAILAIRSNDGTYRDHHFTQNYAWACNALDSGRLRALIVYAVYRQNWSETADTMISMLAAPRPGVVLMLDVESWGGQITGDQSDGINRLYWKLADWIGDRRRIIGYGNTSDLDSLWPTKPDGIRLVVAGYGSNPDYPGKIAHQYTDGNGYGGGLPEGAAPFGNADMDSADGYTLDDFCAAVGLGAPAPSPTPQEAIMTPDQATQLRDVWKQLLGPDGHGWPQLGQNAQGENLTLVDAVAKLLTGGGAAR